MGEVLRFGYGALAAFGLGLTAVGAVRRRRALVLQGAAILVALVGAWLLGPIGLGIGAVLVGFAYREGRRSAQKR